MSHFGLLFNFRDVGVDGVVFNVISGFLRGRVHIVVVYGVRSDERF